MSELNDQNELTLPKEIINEIIRYLPLRDRFTFETTCKLFLSELKDKNYYYLLVLNFLFDFVLVFKIKYYGGRGVGYLLGKNIHSGNFYKDVKSMIENIRTMYLEKDGLTEELLTKLANNKVKRIRNMEEMCLSENFINQ